MIPRFTTTSNLEVSLYPGDGIQIDSNETVRHIFLTMEELKELFKFVAEYDTSILSPINEKTC